MNKKENTQDFSLEDILQEFGTSEDTADKALSDADMAELAGEVGMSLEDFTASVEIPQPVIPDLAEEAETEVSGDTIRVETLGKPVSEDVPEETPADMPEDSPENAEEPVSGDTVRIDPVTEDAAQEQPEESPAQEPEKEEAPVAPPTIVMHPRARLRELKRKLVAGPEKRYYDLTEIGTGRLQIAMIVNFVIVVLCMVATASFAMDLVPANRLKLMIFSQVLAMMISALLGCYLLMDAIGELFKGKFTLNTLLFVTLIACIADAVFCLQQQRVPCCAAFSLSMSMALWDRSLKRKTEMAQMDTLRKAVRLDSIVKVPDYHDGREGILRGDGQVEDFMDNYQTTSGPEKVQNLYAILSLLACIGIAALCFLRHGLSLALQVFATSLLVATPASFFVALSRPMHTLEKKLHMVGSVLCGWQGVKGLCGTAAFPLRDEDLFPIGASKLNGVKFYGERNPDEIVSYATALIKAHDNGLAPVFENLLKSRNGMEYSVENMQYYGDGGIGGEVREEPVLMGTQHFLQEMGVEIPEGTMVNQAIYCAIDGQLCAVFAIAYAKMKSAAAGLVTLCGYRKLTPVVICGDYMITESFLRSKFGIRTRRFAFPAGAVRKDLRKVRPAADSKAYALTTQDNLVSVAYTVTGAQAVRTASRIGIAIHLIGGIVGLLIMAALAFLGSTQLLTPVNVLLYQLIWMIPGLLITEWTRTV